jgi:hypothetical protein
VLAQLERRVDQRDAVGLDRLDAVAAVENLALAHQVHAIVAREHHVRRPLVLHLARDAVRHRRRRDLRHRHGSFRDRLARGRVRLRRFIGSEEVDARLAQALARWQGQSLGLRADLSFGRPRDRLRLRARLRALVGKKQTAGAGCGRRDDYPAQECLIAHGWSLSP